MVTISASSRVLVALFVLVSHTKTVVPLLIVGGLVLLGAPYFRGMLIFDRAALETEPGDANLVVASSEVTE